MAEQVSLSCANVCFMRCNEAEKFHILLGSLSYVYTFKTGYALFHADTSHADTREE